MYGLSWYPVLLFDVVSLPSFAVCTCLSEAAGERERQAYCRERLSSCPETQSLDKITSRKENIFVHIVNNVYGRRNHKQDQVGFFVLESSQHQNVFVVLTDCKDGVKKNGIIGRTFM